MSALEQKSDHSYQNSNKNPHHNPPSAEEEKVTSQKFEDIDLNIPKQQTNEETKQDNDKIRGLDCKFTNGKYEMYEVKFNQWLILVTFYGDVTTEEADAIVNPSNESLTYGSGLSGIILRKGGKEILTQTKEWVQKNKKLNIGDVAYTTSGDLKNCKTIIHSVGPHWSSKKKQECMDQLKQTVINALTLANNQLYCETIAIPLIRTGSSCSKFPKMACITVMYEAVEEFARTQTFNSLKMVKFVNFDIETAAYCGIEFQRRYHDSELREIPDDELYKMSKCCSIY